MNEPASPTARTPRPRDAEATREAILASARRAFAQAGYDGAGVREIAAGAGVTAMMVNRYFGSKEQLFADVVEDTMTQGSLIAGGIMDQPEPGKALARALVLEPPGPLPADGVAVERLVAERLGLRPGDPVRLGEARLRLAALIVAEPDKVATPALFGPRALVGLTALAGSGSAKRWVRAGGPISTTSPAACSDWVRSSSPIRRPER